MLLENDTQINMQNNLYHYKKSTHPTILYEQPEIDCYKRFLSNDLDFDQIGLHWPFFAVETIYGTYTYSYLQ